MHISVRRFIFAFFVAVFLISAPLVVLYTAGYRLNISNHRLFQTGVLAITTYPRGANMYVNNQVLAQRTPYVIQRLVVNQYHLKLDKKGYHAWEQNVGIQEGKTTYVTTRLFAQSTPTPVPESERARILTLEEQRVADPASSPISLTDNGSHIEVHSSDSPTAPLIGLLPQDTYRILQDDEQYVILTNERNLGFIISRDGGKVVELPTRIAVYDWLEDENLLLLSDGNEITIYDAGTEATTFITRQSEVVTDLAWHPSADSFFVATQDSITAFDRNVYETRPTYVLVDDTPIKEFWLDAQGKTIYFTQPDDTETLLELPLVL